MVKFISYTGEYPNLCSGVFTVEIDGKEVRFNNYRDKEGVNPCFWYSGGHCLIDDETESVIQKEWEFNVEDLPKEYVPYAEELFRIFSEEVPWGCCGGCI